jgi:hypothetical protein
MMAIEKINAVNERWESTTEGSLKNKSVVTNKPTEMAQKVEADNQANISVAVKEEHSRSQRVASLIEVALKARGHDDSPIGSQENET